MRLVVARRIGRLGTGLGNEMIPLAKGWIASHVLNARLVGPSWGLSRYGYYRNFGTSRADFILEDLLARLPHYDFTEDEYRKTGHVDFGRAISHWARERGFLEKRSFIVTVSSMWGGYAAIASAAPFLLSTMLSSKNALENLHEITRDLDRKKLFVAVHFRAGKDIKELPENENARGKFNIKIPVDWYIRVCESLRAAFGDSIEFRIVTDRAGPEYQQLLRRFNPSQRPQKGLTEVSDLLLLTYADLRICSVSSYSLMASFISGGPYVWYEPQLVQKDGVYSLWGNEDAQQVPGSLTFENSISARALRPEDDIEKHFRGFPVRATDTLPPGLLQRLCNTLQQKTSPTDLLAYGAFPKWNAHT